MWTALPKGVCYDIAIAKKKGKSNKIHSLSCLRGYGVVLNAIR